MKTCLQISNMKFNSNYLLGLTLICGESILGDDILALIGDGARLICGLELGERPGEHSRGDEGRLSGEDGCCKFCGDEGRRMVVGDTGCLLGDADLGDGIRIGIGLVLPGLVVGDRARASRTLLSDPPLNSTFGLVLRGDPFA